MMCITISIPHFRKYNNYYFFPSTPFDKAKSLADLREKSQKTECKQSIYSVFHRPWGPFLESPGNFTGPKSNIQIEISRVRARVLASRLLHFVSLTDCFIMLDAKLLKP